MERIIFLDAKFQEVAQSSEPYVNWCDDMVVSIKYIIDGEKEMWLSLYQRNDVPCFYLSSEDIFDKLVHIIQNPIVMRNRIQYFYGFNIDWYETMFPAIQRLSSSPFAQLIRLICYFARENEDKAQAFVNNYKNHLIGSFDIPTTDIEQMSLNLYEREYQEKISV